MASQSVAGASRLAQMQMRFQQKQIQEREQRRVEMTESTSSEATSVLSGTTVGQKNANNGKVRQMFDERRRGAGIDRSHPLKPIAASSMSRTSKSTTTLSTTATRSSGGVGGATAARKPPPVQTRRQVNVRRTVVRSEGGTGSRDLNMNHDELDSPDNGAFSKQFSSMSLNDNRLNGVGDRNNNKNNNSGSRSEAYSREQSSSSIKLKPVVTKKSPTAAVTRAPARQATPAVSSGSGFNRAPRPVAATVQRHVSATVKTPPKVSGSTMSSHNTLAMKQSAPMAGMAACRYCGRHFNDERLSKHEQVCQKMMSTKRKVFDASKHRVKGTEAEKYLRKPPNARGAARASMQYSSAAAVSGTAVNASPKKNNWRKKHEEFIAAIRAAKQVQTHLARGGKLSDLPPPPPSENPDYIQCPHCLRRFNQAAAERHIPRCATMLHNKPKAGSNSAVKKR